MPLSSMMKVERTAEVSLAPGWIMS